MKKQIDKHIFSLYKKKLPYTFLLSGGVSLIIILLFAICALFFYLTSSTSYSDIFGILLLAIFLTLVVGILSPFIYSYFANYTVLDTENKDKVGIKSLFKTSLFGFKPPYRGLLSSFTNLLFSILLYIVLYSLFSGIIYMCFAYFNPAIKGIMDQINSIVESGGNNFSEIIEKVYEIMGNNQNAFYIPDMIINLISLLFVLFFYLRNLILNILKYTVIGHFVNLYKRPFNQLFKMTYRSHRKEISKGITTYGWPIFVSFFIVFIASYLGLFFGCNLSHINSSTFILFISLTSIILSLVVSLLFYPLIFEYYNTIFATFSIYMRTIFNNVMKENATKALSNLNSDKEMEDEIKKVLSRIEKDEEELKKMNEEINNEKENKEEKNDNNDKQE